MYHLLSQRFSKYQNLGTKWLTTKWPVCPPFVYRHHIRWKQVNLQPLFDLVKHRLAPPAQIENWNLTGLKHHSSPWKLPVCVSWWLDLPTPPERMPKSTAKHKRRWIWSIGQHNGYINTWTLRSTLLIFASLFQSDSPFMDALSSHAPCPQRLEHKQ